MIKNAKLDFSQSVFWDQRELIKIRNFDLIFGVKIQIAWFEFPYNVVKSYFWWDFQTLCGRVNVEKFVSKEIMVILCALCTLAFLWKIVEFTLLLLVIRRGLRLDGGFSLHDEDDDDEAWLHSGEKWLKNAFFLLDHYLRDQFAISKQHK